jgi:hypothetical protein
MMGAGGGEEVRFSEAGRSATEWLELNRWRQEQPERVQSRCRRGS